MINIIISISIVKLALLCKNQILKLKKLINLLLLFIK